MSLTILVTGGSGLVGRAVYEISKTPEHSQHKFIFLSSKDADLTDINQAEKIFQKYKPKMVIHLAAKVGGLFANMESNLEFFRMNSLMNDNVLLLCDKYGVKKCVSCLSTCIFPNKITYPIDETMIHNGEPHASNYGYSYAKRMIDILNKGYNDKYVKQNLDERPIFTSVIPTNIYGPYDNYNLQNSHVIPGLIHKAYQELIKLKEKGLTNGTLEVCGTGKPLRQFIYSYDLARLILWVLHNYNDTSPIILSVDEDEISIDTAAKLICKSFEKYGVNLSVKYIDAPDGQYKKTASNKKLRSLLPDIKFTAFEEGIQQSVDWLVENYESARK